MSNHRYLITQQSNKASGGGVNPGSSDLESIDRQIKFHKGIVEELRNEVDPRTGERKFAHGEDARKRSALKLKTLESSRVYQLQANERMAAESTAAAQRQADRNQARADQHQAIRDRARAMQIESAAKQLVSTGVNLDAIEGKQ